MEDQQTNEYLKRHQKFNERKDSCDKFTLKMVSQFTTEIISQMNKQKNIHSTYFDVSKLLPKLPKECYDGYLLYQNPYLRKIRDESFLFFNKNGWKVKEYYDSEYVDSMYQSIRLPPCIL